MSNFIITKKPGDSDDDADCGGNSSNSSNNNSDGERGAVTEPGYRSFVRHGCAVRDPNAQILEFCDEFSNVREVRLRNGANGDVIRTGTWDDGSSVDDATAKKKKRRTGFTKILSITWNDTKATESVAHDDPASFTLAGVRWQLFGACGPTRLE